MLTTTRKALNMTTLRNGSLGSLVDLLRDENVRRHDLVVPASQLTMTESGKVGIFTSEPTFDEHGVTAAGWNWVSVRRSRTSLRISMLTRRRTWRTIRSRRWLTLSA